MLSAYLNQKAVFKPCIGSDDRGQPTCGTGKTIDVRKKKYTKNVLTNTGQSVQTSHIYYSEDIISENDMLDGQVVMAVDEWIGLDGSVIGCKAVV